MMEDGGGGLGPKADSAHGVFTSRCQSLPEPTWSEEEENAV